MAKWTKPFRRLCWHWKSNFKTKKLLNIIWKHFRHFRWIFSLDFSHIVTLSKTMEAKYFDSPSIFFCPWHLLWRTKNVFVKIAWLRDGATAREIPLCNYTLGFGCTRKKTRVFISRKNFSLPIRKLFLLSTHISDTFKINRRATLKFRYKQTRKSQPIFTSKSIAKSMLFHRESRLQMCIEDGDTNFPTHVSKRSKLRLTFTSRTFFILFELTIF